jgi:hypothetical protein
LLLPGTAAVDFGSAGEAGAIAFRRAFVPAVFALAVAVLCVNEVAAGAGGGARMGDGGAPSFFFFPIPNIAAMNCAIRTPPSW